MITDLQRKMILKAKRNLEDTHKENHKYKVYPQDIVAELNRANNSLYFYDYYRGVHCTIKEVKEVLV